MLKSFICSKQVIRAYCSDIYTLIFCQAMGYKLRALFFSRLETTSHFSKSGAIAAAVTAMGMGGIRWGNIISCTLGTTSAKKANNALLKISKAKKSCFQFPKAKSF
jgi:prolipoprotein diacylglyceryltransferase